MLSLALPSSQASSNAPAPAGLVLEGTLSLERRIKSIVIHDSELRGRLTAGSYLRGWDDAFEVLRGTKINLEVRGR